MGKLCSVNSRSKSPPLELFRAGSCTGNNVLLAEASQPATGVRARKFVRREIILFGAILVRGNGPSTAVTDPSRKARRCGESYRVFTPMRRANQSFAFTFPLSKKRGQLSRSVLQNRLCPSPLSFEPEIGEQEMEGEGGGWRGEGGRYLCSNLK